LDARGVETLTSRFCIDPTLMSIAHRATAALPARTRMHGRARTAACGGLLRRGEMNVATPLYDKDVVTTNARDIAAGLQRAAASPRAVRTPGSSTKRCF
jgi:hypothetical protein